MRKGTVTNSKAKKDVSVSTSKYINPLTDFGFKYIFGEKKSLMDFLNSVLDIEGGIVELTYNNPERIPHSEEERKAKFDLHCTTGTGERVIIEMQNHSQKFFKDRTLYYATFPIQDQAVKGKEWDFKLTPVYSVNIVNFCMDTDTRPPSGKPREKYASYVQLLDVNTKKVFYPKLTFVYLELERFNRAEKKLKNGVERWMYVLKNLSSLTEIPKKLRNEVFGQVFEMAEIAKLPKKLRDDYYNSLKTYRDMNNIIAFRDEQIADLKLENAMFRKENATYKEEAATYKEEAATFKKENTMFKKENAELRRLLGLKDSLVN